MVISRERLKALIINLSVLGSVLSLSTTRLRITDDIGYGEICILLSIFIFALNFKFLVQNRSANYVPSKFILGFVLFSFIGFLYTTLFIDRLYTDSYFSNLIRTSAAYLLSICNAIQLSLLICNKIDVQYVFKRILFYFLIVNVISFGLLFGNLWEGMFGVTRFSGFSKNPNQLGTMTSIVPFLSLYLHKNKEIKFPLLVFSLFVCAVLAKAISSDALYYSLIVCVFLYFFFTFKSYNIQLRVILILLFLIVFYNLVLNSLEHYIVETNDVGDQAGVRYILWGNALTAVLSSPLVGFGPGSYSGMNGPFGGAESHNTFIDYLTNTGIFGLYFFCLFIYKILYRLYLMNEYFLLMSVCSLLTFGFFHNILRHPIFWILLFSLYSFNHVYHNKLSKC